MSPHLHRSLQFHWSPGAHLEILRSLLKHYCIYQLCNFLKRSALYPFSYMEYSDLILISFLQNLSKWRLFPEGGVLFHIGHIGSFYWKNCKIFSRRKPALFTFVFCSAWLFNYFLSMTTWHSKQVSFSSYLCLYNSNTCQLLEPSTDLFFVLRKKHCLPRSK